MQNETSFFHEANTMSQSYTRRMFFGRMTAGSLGTALIFSMKPSEAHAALFGRKSSRVSLVPGDDQREATYQSLKAIEDDIKDSISSRQVILKVNAGMAGPEYRCCSTDVEQMRGILDFFAEFYDRKIIIAEGTATPACSVFIGYENYDYLDLKKEYDVKFVDSNDFDTIVYWSYQGDHHPKAIGIIDLFLDPDNYIISATRLKTAGGVIATLSMKNVIMGSPICHYKWKSGQKNEKSWMHGGKGSKRGRELSFNIFQVAVKGVTPDLAVLDGVVGAEGNGPWHATPIEHGVALASTDPVACDRLGVELMGIDYSELKYLQWCAQAGLGMDNLDKIRIVGPDYTKYIMKYKLNENYETQRAWIYDEI